MFFGLKLIAPKYVYVLAPGMCEYRHYINTEGRGQSANTYFKNNSSNIFSCIRTHANTGPTCIRAKINSSRIFFLHVLVLCRGVMRAIDSIWQVAVLSLSSSCTSILQGQSKHSQQQELFTSKVDCFVPPHSGRKPRMISFGCR